MQAYSDQKRASDPHALPNIEVFHHQCGRKRDYCMGEPADYDGEGCPGPGWYWWACFPGCLPDGDPRGPFATEAEALADAQDSDA